MGQAAFTEIPNGIPGIEERVNLLYTYGVKQAVWTFTVSSMPPAPEQPSCSDCFRAKAQLLSGRDADLVVFDPTYKGTVSVKSQHVNNNYNGFEGCRMQGRPSAVAVRGKVQARDGEFVGERGRGVFLKRDPVH